MTNLYTTKKDLNSTEKFILVRINPARSILNELILVSANTYSMTFPFLTLNKIEVNGIEFTRVSTYPDTLEYSFNEDTLELVITLWQPLAAYSPDGNIIAYYYLFYTNDKFRICKEDPNDFLSNERYWEPRLQNDPTFDISQDGIIDAFLTIGNTNITLLNSDNDFQKHLNRNTSFARKEVKVWHCLDNVNNYQNSFTGYINSLTLTESVSISIDNIFSVFTDTFYSNTNSTDSIFNTTDYPNIYSTWKDTPIYHIYSKSSYTKAYDPNGVAQPIPASASLTPYYVFEDGYRLVNVNFNSTRSQTNNRTWATGRVGGLTGLRWNATNVTTIAANTLYEVDVADSDYFRPGDNIAIDPSYYGYYVWSVVSANRIQIVTYAGSGNTYISNGDSLYHPDVSLVQIFDKETDTVVYSLVYLRDYALTSGPNQEIYVLLHNNFESNFGSSYNLYSGIWHDSDIIYRIHNRRDLSHGTIIKNMLIKAGISVNTASFTTANLTDMQVNFSIPFYNDTAFGTLQDYLQAILNSTFGHLYLDDNFAIGYRLINPIAPTETITEDEMMEGSLTQEINYSDIVDTIFYSNIHGDHYYQYIGWWSSFVLEEINNGTESYSNMKQNKYLHGVTKQKTINYVIQSMINSKSRIEKVLSAQKIKLQFSTKGKNFSTMLGDDYIIESSNVVGSTGQAVTKILATTKGTYNTNITALELSNL